MKAQWSPEDLLTLEQRLPQQGIQNAAAHVSHTLRETYDQAMTMGYMPPNGRGPWPRKSRKSSWPAADEHILRQEFMGPPSVPYIAEVLGRSVDEVEEMAARLELVVRFEAPAHTTNRDNRSNRSRVPKLTLVQNPPADSLTQAKSRAATGEPTESLEPWISPAKTTAVDLAKALNSFKSFSKTLALPAVTGFIDPLPERAKWTPAKDRYLKAHYHKQPVEEIAQKIGMSYYQTTARARRLGVSNTITVWSREDTIFLLENIQTEPLRWIAEKLGRSILAVNLRPKQLGIFPGWTGHDDQVLLKHFGKLTLAEIGEKIARPAYAIEKREKFLRDEDFEFSRAGLRRLFAEKGQEWVDGLIYLPVRPAQEKRHKWTQSDIETLTKNYPSKGSLWCAAKLGIVVEKVQSKAQALGLHSDKVSPPWTPEEDQWLLDNVHVLDRMACAKKLNRTKGAVSVRASVLGAFKDA